MIIVTPVLHFKHSIWAFFLEVTKPSLFACTPGRIARHPQDSLKVNALGVALAIVSLFYTFL